MKLETQCIHAGTRPDPATNARAIPIYRTSSYVFDSTEHAANLFALRELGNIYTRLMNPTQDALEQRVAAIEGGAAALAHASGTAAIFNSINNICKAGDEIVSADNLYGGTFTMFNDLFPQFGYKTKFVDPNEPENFAAAITPKTKALFCETLSNPAGDVADVEAIAAIAHAHGIPLIIDSTFTTPVLQRSIEFGADIVINSLTKWMGGHGTGIGGIVVDSGKFNWQSDKFPLMTDPDPSYHGVRWAYDLPEPLAAVAYRDSHARRADAQSRRLYQSGQRLAVHAGNRNAHAAHGTALRERATRCRVPQRPLASRVGPLSRACPATPPTTRTRST